MLVEAIKGHPDAADLYYDLSEKHYRAGDLDGYAKFFHQAFVRKPVVDIGWPVDTPDDSREASLEKNDRARALITRGVRFAPVIAALAITEGQLGREASISRLMDFERFMLRGQLEPPDGTSVADFNGALAEEIKSDLTYYDMPADRSIRRAWRFNALHRTQSPAMRSFLRLLKDTVAGYIAGLPEEPDHPFLAVRPDEFEVGGWAVVSDGRSYHKPHLHPRAWATGVYYVVQPEISRESERGWLRVGPPPKLRDAWEPRLIEPVPGSFVLMPGYFWHETEPMGVDQERICIAFEVRSPELALGDEDGDY